MKNKVLVSAIGGPTGLGIIKALCSDDDVFVIGLDMDSFCPVKKYVDKFITCPAINDSNYIDFVNKLIRENGVDLYFPTLQPELMHIEKICCSVASPQKSLIDLTLDKVKLYKYLQSENFESIIPDYVVINCYEDLRMFYDKYKLLKRPICLKEVNGHGGVGFKIIDTPTNVASSFLKGQSSNRHTLKAIEEIFNGLGLSKDSLMGCEYLDGEEFSIDVVAQEGTVKAIVTRRRNRVSNGIVLEGEVIENLELIRIVEKIALMIGLHGFSNIQFRYHEGKPKLIDFNPRFCGSQLISFGAGINFPRMVIDLLKGVELPKLEVKWGMRSKRYWEMEFCYED